MMSGGLFMMGFGLIAMLMFIGLPVVLIVVLIWALTRRGNSSVLVSAPSSATTSTAPTCSHCGAALQVAWSHCPQCGVQV